MENEYKFLEWDEHNLYKNEIKHNVTVQEITQCFNNPSFIAPHKKYKDRRIMLGITDGSKYLFIVFQHISKERARPIHARNMKNNERSIYERYKSRNY